MTITSNTSNNTQPAPVLPEEYNFMPTDMLTQVKLRYYPVQFIYSLPNGYDISVIDNYSIKDYPPVLYRWEAMILKEGKVTYTTSLMEDPKSFATIEQLELFLKKAKLWALSERLSSFKEIHEPKKQEGFISKTIKALCFYGEASIIFSSIEQDGNWYMQMDILKPENIKVIYHDDDAGSN